MKTVFLEKSFGYDGTQLRPLFGYLDHGVLGDSIVAWVGSCDVGFAHMIDGEDLREKAAIRGGKMLHLIAEIFDRDLFAGVALQRLIAGIAIDLIHEMSPAFAAGPRLRRDGDDIYWDRKKLSISIASRSALSVQVHFAMNISNEGTPVPTCALEDFSLDAAAFGAKLLSRISSEYDSILEATRKVRPLGGVS